MSKFQMTCSCGDSYTVDAEDRDGAITQIKGMMDQAAITAHMTDKHPGDPVMSVEECHAMVEQGVVPVA